MKSYLSTLMLAIAALGCGAVQAQGYVGGGVGPARIDIDCTGATTCDKTSTGYKLFGGFRSPSGFAGELVYFDWGKVEATQVSVELGTASGELKASGWGLGMAYFAPFTPQWQGVLRLGVLRNKAKASGTIGGTSGSTSETSTQPYYGLGVSYRFTPNLAVDAAMDFSRIKILGEKADTRLISAGLTYSF